MTYDHALVLFWICAFIVGVYYLGFYTGKAKALAERLSLECRHLTLRVPSPRHFDVVTEDTGDRYVMPIEQKEGGNNA